MGNRRADEPRRIVSPVIHIPKERSNLFTQSPRVGRDKMDPLHHPMSRDYTHRPVLVATQFSDQYSHKPRIACRKKRRVPGAKALQCHGLLPIARRVEHHVRPRLGFVRDRSLRGRKHNLHPPRHAGSHVVAVQPLALDCRGMQYLRGKRLAHGLLPQVKADCAKPPGELPQFKSASSASISAASHLKSGQSLH